MPLLCVVFSVWINVSISQGCWEMSFCWGSSGNVNLAVGWLLVSVFSPEINCLLLCFWFPGSWLVLPRQTLNTAPLFSPQEQCLNAESIPTLTEDAPSWIWGEVGSYDAWGREKGGTKKHQSKWLAIEEAPRHWKGFASLSWWILSTDSKGVIFSSALWNSIPPGAGVLSVALFALPSE